MKKNRLAERKEQAIEREEVRQRKSIDEQMAIIKKRRGKSLKEIAKLLTLKEKDKS